MSIAKTIIRPPVARGAIATPVPTLPPNSGLPEDQFQTARMYATGSGVSQDPSKSFEWYLKAAAQGHLGAQSKVGMAYYTGLGVPQDFAQAVKWFRLAAESGDTEAQAGLGVCYFKGEGLSADFVEAYRWLVLASVGGDKAFSQFRDLVASKLTNVQVADAQRLAREWKPNNTAK